MVGNTFGSPEVAFIETLRCRGKAKLVIVDEVEEIARWQAEEKSSKPIEATLQKWKSHTD